VIRARSGSDAQLIVDEKGDGRMIKRSLYLILTLVVLSGCAGSIQLAENNRSRLTAVYLDDEISFKHDMYYMGPGASLLGAVGALTQLSPGEQLHKIAEDHDIRMDTLVRQAMIDSLNASGKTGLCDNADQASAVMKLEVRAFGFSVPHGFSSNLIPVLDVKAELHDPAGQIIWRSVKSLPFVNCPITPMPAKEIWGNVENIRSTWTGAAQYVARIIVADL
jgi:hypothetical protein